MLYNILGKVPLGSLAVNFHTTAYEEDFHGKNSLKLGNLTAFKSKCAAQELEELYGKINRPMNLKINTFITAKQFMGNITYQKMYR